MKNLKVPLLAMLLSLTATAAQAQILVFNFATPPSSGQASAGYTTPQPTETTSDAQVVTPFTPPMGITVSTLSASNGLYSNNGGAAQGVLGYYTLSGASSGVASDVSLNDYELFTITVQPGYLLSLTSATVTTGNGYEGSFSGNSYLTSSITGMSTALGSGANGGLFSPYSGSHALAPYTVDLTSSNAAAGLAFQNLSGATGPITFYIPEDSAGNYTIGGVENLSFEGMVTQIPEPGTWACLLAGLAASFLLARAHRAKTGAGLCL